MNRTVWNTDMSQLSQISGPKEKKTGIIHKQSLKRDDTGNLTFCDYYLFCRKFCFGSKIRRNGQESLFWESLYLTRKRHLYSPQGRIQKIQIAVAGKLASYMYSFHFAALIEKITQKLTGKKVGEIKVEGARPPRPSSKSAHGPDGVLQSCHPDGYSTAVSYTHLTLPTKRIV